MYERRPKDTAVSHDRMFAAKRDDLIAELGEALLDHGAALPARCNRRFAAAIVECHPGLGDLLEREALGLTEIQLHETLIHS